MVIRYRIDVMLRIALIIFKNTVINRATYAFIIVFFLYQGFDDAAEKNETYKMSSFAETTALGYLKSQAIGNRKI